MKWLHNLAKTMKEREAEERFIGYKLTGWELSMLRKAKEKDSHFAEDYVSKFGEYNRLVNEIRERKRICSVYLSEKPRKRDLGLGFGLGIGVGIVTAVFLHAENMPINISDRTTSDNIIGGLIIVSIFCFCIIMGLLSHKDGEDG